MAKSKDSDVPDDLYTVGSKIRGLAGLFRSTTEVCLEEQALHGIAYVLTDIAEQIDRIGARVEGRND